MESARSSCPLLRHLQIPLVAQVYLQECFVPESRWLGRGCYICKKKKKIYLGALSCRIFTLSPNQLFLVSRFWRWQAVYTPCAKHYYYLVFYLLLMYFLVSSGTSSPSFGKLLYIHIDLTVRVFTDSLYFPFLNCRLLLLLLSSCT